jgi:hypothetical protein
LSFVGITVAFTFEGLAKLGVWGLDKIEDASFRAGLAANSPLLNDPIAGEGSPENWVVGGKAQALHGLVMVAGPTEPPTGALRDPVEAHAAFLEALAGKSWRVLRKEFGQTREGARGHEHFGFKDGVSQPGVRGQIDQAFPGRVFLNPGRNANDPEQGLPGQDLVWPGEFVFGYPAQGEKSDDGPTADKQGGPSWMKNGSFLVYRRLKQLVPEFEQYVEERAGALGMDSELLAAAGRAAPRLSRFLFTTIRNSVRIPSSIMPSNSRRIRTGGAAPSPPTSENPILAMTSMRTSAQKRRMTSTSDKSQKDSRRSGVFFAQAFHTDLGFPMMKSGSVRPTV